MTCLCLERSERNVENYERGGGGATKRAAKKWMYNISPWDEEKNDDLEIKNYFMAGGNGVAMRIMPHTFSNENDVEKVMKQVVLNKDAILQIKDVLEKVSDANDFIEILHSIMEIQDKGGIKKEDSDLLKAKWKKYRLSKKQIDMIVKIILS